MTALPSAMRSVGVSVHFSAGWSWYSRSSATGGMVSTITLPAAESAEIRYLMLLSYSSGETP